MVQESLAMDQQKDLSVQEELARMVLSTFRINLAAEERTEHLWRLQMTSKVLHPEAWGEKMTELARRRYWTGDWETISMSEDSH